MKKHDREFEELLKRSSLGTPDVPPGQRGRREHVEVVRKIVELRRRMSHPVQPGDPDAAAIELSQLLFELGYDGQAEQVLPERPTGPAQLTSMSPFPGPHQPLAVVVVGRRHSGRRAVVGALLDVPEPELPLAPDSLLVFKYGRETGTLAHVPGYREPQLCEDPTGKTLARPPRRIELTLPNPLLRHFELVDTADSETLSVAGHQVVLDAARRGGALLYVISADQSFDSADLDLLAKVASGPAVTTFVVTPSVDTGWSMSERPAIPGGFNQASLALDAHRAALRTAVPALTDARWFAMDSGTNDTAQLRRALVGWAADEGLARASAMPPIAPGAEPILQPATVTVTDRAHWVERLDREVRSGAQRIRQQVALEMANIHLRCVQELVFGSTHSRFPGLLDRELHALSLVLAAACDRGVENLLQALTRVLGDVAERDVVRRGLTAGVYQHFEDRGGDLNTLLLVTRSGTVVGLFETGVGPALGAFPSESGNGILPPVDVALSAGCYQAWRDVDNADTSRARSWLQRALREVELALSREVSRRFEALGLALAAVLVDQPSVLGPEGPHTVAARSVSFAAHRLDGEASPGSS